MADETARAALRLSHVSKSFAAPGHGRPTLVLDDVSLAVAAGEFVCVVGPSGCGKSTILNLIAGLETPSAGTVEKDGVPVTGPGPDRGVMFQDYALYPWQTVEENVGFGLNHGTPGAGLTRAERRERIADVIDLVSLRGAEGKYPHQLSGGMRQRVALARLLANGPDILLMDEPLGALDAQTRLILQVELLRIWGERRPRAQRKTVLFITHDIDEAVFLADRVVILSRHPGRLRAEIPVDLPRPRGDHTRALPRFGALAEEIWGLIRDEARAAIG
ncbi:ABC transporter ATP-binding protein [Methylobacterium sp. JK268]